jgi:hypothetical protein
MGDENKFEAGIRETVKKAQDALDKQFKDSGYVVDEVSVMLQMRAVSKADESIIMQQPSIAITGIGTDHERVIKAKLQGPQG